MKFRSLIPALLLALIASGANAHEYKLGPLVIDHPWTRATPRGAAVAGGYVKITNTGTTADRLTGGSAEIAKRFEVHEMSMDGGVMRMRELKNGLEIPPGATVELRPGSYHIMMMNLARPVAKGDRIKASLTFEKAGTIDLEFAAQDIGGNRGGGKAKEHNH